MRNVIGAVLAVIGAAATLISPWQSWYAGRHGSTYKFWEVFGSGVTQSRSGIMDSVFLVFLVTAILVVVGALLRSRALMAFGSVVALGFSILWMVRQGNAAGELVISTHGNGLGQGVANALGGSVLMLIGSLMMTGRPKRAATAPAPAQTPRSTPAPVQEPAQDWSSTRAYDAGRAEGSAAAADAAKSAKASAGTGSTALTPEDTAIIDKLDDPPKN